MKPFFPWIRRLAYAAACLFFLLEPGRAHAIDIEKLVMPGPVIAGHADVEGECRKCHSPFERGAEPQLCLACHEEVALDLETHTGFHGHDPAIAAAVCRSCHPEHHGRDADITGLHPETFDHANTDHPLTGAHRRTPCASCHPAGKKHREAPKDCVACHEEDDRHAGRLGAKCETCHDASGWRETRFDHASTDFPLKGGHVGVTCALCHTDDRYRDTPSKCADCHTVNDVHRGGFGQNCESCHSVGAWTKVGFNHDTATEFRLRGAHRTAPCAQCHGKTSTKSQAKPRAKTKSKAASGKTKQTAGPVAGTRCIDCHRADDEHRGSFGTGCNKCHGSTRWQKIRFDHARDAKLPLEGAHKDLSCLRCHPGRLDEKRADTGCYSCHVADDVHAGQEGRSCELCHSARGWSQQVRFDHDLAAFPLLGLHAVASCEACHADAKFKDAPSGCQECHEAEDVHEGALGKDCQDCHDPNGWSRWRFEHDRQTDFPLKGKHEGLACAACHDTRALGRVRLADGCESCHSADDPHTGSFGSRCGDCHLEDGWATLRMGR